MSYSCTQQSIVTFQTVLYAANLTKLWNFVCPYTLIRHYIIQDSQTLFINNWEKLNYIDIRVVDFTFFSETCAPNFCVTGE